MQQDSNASYYINFSVSSAVICCHKLAQILFEHITLNISKQIIFSLDAWPSKVD